jgi:hypothetical protein
MSNGPEKNLFSNEGKFNSKRNPNREPITTHLSPIPPGGSGGGKEGGDLDIPTPTDEIPSREVTNLMKIYQDEEKKFEENCMICSELNCKFFRTVAIKSESSVANITMRSRSC